MIIPLIVSGALIWWFVGLVAAQLIWRELPKGRGSFIFELGPFAFTVFFFLSLTGPALGYFYASRAAANKIEESRARKQVRDAMIDEENKLVLEYHEKLLAEDGLSDIAMFDPSEGRIQ